MDARRLMDGSGARGMVAVPFSICIALLGCGGGSSALRAESAPSTASEATSQPQNGGGLAVASDPNPAALIDPQTEVSDPRLADRAEVPGTGVSMRAPHEATRMPMGAGFVDPHGRFEIFVAVASGSPQALNEMTNVAEGAHEISREDVTIGGHQANLIVDSETGGGIEIERVWTVVHDGDRVLAILAAYRANAAERLRDLVRASILSARWDTHAAIEPERAVGFRLAAPEGLAAEPQVVNGVTYVEPGQHLSPESGRPAMLLFPLPIEVPAAQRASACEQLLLMAGPIAADAVTMRATIATDTMQGCELFGAEPIPNPVAGGPQSLATYAAIVFLDQGSFMVAGFVDAANWETWAPRFSAAARTVGRVVR